MIELRQNKDNEFRKNIHVGKKTGKIDKNIDFETFFAGK